MNYITLAMLLFMTTLAMPSEIPDSIKALADPYRYGTEKEIRQDHGDDLCTIEDKLKYVRNSIIILQSLGVETDYPMPKRLENKPLEYRKKVAQSCACTRRGICK